MKKILEKLQSLPDWQNQMKYQCKSNGLKLGALNSLTLDKVKSIYSLLEKKYEEKETQKESELPIEWIEREKVIYPFILITISVLHKIPILSFGSEQYNLILQIFRQRTRSFLQYQTMLFLNNKSVSKRKWEKPEQALLLKLIDENERGSTSKIRWKSISKKLYEISDFQYFRLGKSCRQRWYNHLDPTKKHGNWDKDEDKFILDHVINKGRKWSSIVKLMGSQRTEHMIKNRFKSLLLKCQNKYTEPVPEEKLIQDLVQAFNITRCKEIEIKPEDQKRRRKKKQKNTLTYSSNSQQPSSSPEQSQSEQQIKIEGDLQGRENEIIKEEQAEKYPLKVEEMQILKKQSQKAEQVFPQSPFCFYQGIPTPRTIQPLTPIFSPTMPMYLGSFGQSFTNFQYMFMNQSFPFSQQPKEQKHENSLNCNIQHKNEQNKK